MSQLISQNLTIPAGLADGSTAKSGHVIPLYNALNAFVLPDVISGFSPSTADDTLYTLAIGGTVTHDYSVTVPQLRSALVMLPFTYNTVAGSQTGRLVVRINGTAVTSTASGTLTTTPSGNGMMVLFVSPRSTDIRRGLVGLIVDQSLVRTFTANADIPATDITSIGIEWSVDGGSTGNLLLKHARFWREG